MSLINLSALWKIVVFGLLAGAGLPAIFAVGLLSLSRGPKTRTAGAGSEAVVGGSAGVIVDLLILVAVSAVIYARSRASKVNHANVNDEWTGLVTPAEPQPIAAA